MNLEYIFNAQVDLDKAFRDSRDKNELYFDKKIVIALLVELGEFANEVKAFKYWKKDKSINRQAMLEEFADGIHFLTSIAYKNHVSPEIKLIKHHDDFSVQLAYTYQLFTKLFKKMNKKSIAKAYGAYLALGQIMNISYDDIVKSYIEKNKKNYQRIKDNY
ncbi:dUTP diphosphatase [Metamycoplasma spumans]|uniref:dUTP diphosphatase n=1 Tax=Metamycoplasma spumans TaxID=92406 RepID=UPI0034DD0497